MTNDGTGGNNFSRNLVLGACNDMTCGVMTCEMNNLEIRVKFVFSPDVILCG